jgi:hypothetical protein
MVCIISCSASTTSTKLTYAILVQEAEPFNNNLIISIHQQYKHCASLWNLQRCYGTYATGSSACWVQQQPTASLCLMTMRPRRDDAEEEWDCQQDNTAAPHGGQLITWHPQNVQCCYNADQELRQCLKKWPGYSCETCCGTGTET